MLGLAIVVPVVMVQTVLVARALSSADSPTRQELSHSREFRCGVWGLSSAPIYTSYPLAKFLIADEIIGVLTPMLGAFVIHKGEVPVIIESWALLRRAIIIRSGKRKLRLIVSDKDWPAICSNLDSMSWNHQLGKS